MESLEVFTASNNNRRGSDGLIGILPTSLGLLADLKKFDVSDNAITGQIPAALGQCTNLEILYLHQNALTGDVPSNLGNLGNIVGMYLHINDLEGEVPEDLCRAGEREVQVDCTVACAEDCCMDYDSC